MTGQLAIFTVPPDAVVTLQHDAGPLFTGVPTIIADRPAHLLTIDQDVPDGQGARLLVTRPGFVPLNQRGILWLSRPGPGGFATFAVDDVTLSAGGHPFPEAGRLLVQGTRLFREDGSPYTVIGCSDFALLERLLRGEDIWPIVDERVRLGFTRLRIFGMYSPGSFIGGGRGLNPADFGAAYWSAAETLLDGLADRSIRAGLTLFASAKGVMPSAAAQRDYFARWDALLAPRWHTDLELVNEQGLHDNSVDLSLFPRPQTPIASRGSGGAGLPVVTPPWSVTTPHTGRTDEWPRKSAHNPKEDCEDPLGVPAWSDEPVGAAEVAIPGRRDNRPVRFRDAAAGGALIHAGTTFHSEAGKDSLPFGPLQHACAEDFVAGARAVDLRFRGGAYTAGHLHDCPIVHRADWSSRTYARILGNACTVVVIDRTPAWRLVPLGDWTFSAERHGVVELAR